MARDEKPISWEEYRRRMLRETEAFIEWGLAHPDAIVEIPAKPIGQGGFPAEVGRWFWNVVLTDKVDATVSRFRRLLLDRPKNLISRWRSR
ncbi:MAG: hypothetical protein ACLFV7_14325 [Phycisphaerae bacterium]